eukprot:scaffold7893_cov69-Cyclotella_meneghiniana.AAC.1
MTDKSSPSGGWAVEGELGESDLRVERSWRARDRASPLLFRRLREKVVLSHRKYRIYQVES